MAKKTFSSVTEEPCSCGYMERAANDPETPLVFDKMLNEYQFEYKNPDGEGVASMVIYHCPFCGGAAPESLRGETLARVTRQEERRLNEVLENIKTLEDAIAILGNPDVDNPHGVTVEVPEKRGKGSDSSEFT